MNEFGQMLWTFFPEEQWEMVHELAKIDNKAIEDVVGDIVNERMTQLRRDWGLD